MEHELAVAASVRRWPDILRRYLADHGGARVRFTAMTPEELAGQEFDALVIDDVCSFLTPRLVADLRAAGRRVVGIYDAEEAPEGRIRLERCGIELVVEKDAGPEGVLVALSASVSESVPAPAETARGTVVVVAGPRGGCGRTEVATALAAHLARTDGPAILADLDVDRPAVAVRLGLAPHPNLATALDHHRHGRRDPADALQWSRRLGVLVGRPRGVHRATWGHDVGGLVGRLAADAAWLVVDAGENALGPVGSILRRGDRVVAVAAPDPVGVARLVDWYAELPEPRPTCDVLVNRAPGSPFLRGEIAAEVTRSMPVSGFGFLPVDDGVSTAAWDGLPVRRGPFHRALVRWMGRSQAGTAA